jgi:hypothetical protein
VQAELRAFGKLLFGASMQILLLGCQSFVLTTNPGEVEIYLRNIDSSDEKSLGRSPQTLTPNAIGTLKIQEPFVVTFKRSGYVEESLLMSRIPSAGTLVVKLRNLSETGEATEINKVVRLVLEGERALLEKNKKNALDISAEIKKINPSVALAYVIEGTAYLLDGNSRDARSAFIRAVELDSTDLGSRKILAEIDSKLGLPAQTPSGGSGK